MFTMSGGSLPVKKKGKIKHEEEKRKNMKTRDKRKDIY